jgi:hypothetical protein
VNDSIAREIKKAQVTFKSLTPITRDQIQLKSQYLRSNMFIKEKRDGTVSARLPIDVSSQTPDTYNSTYAGTSDAEKLLCLISAIVADAAHRHIPLQTGSFDIPAAFLQFGLPRSATNGFQLYTTLPKSLPSPLSGKLNEITGPQYGMKQSNGIFSKEFNGIMTKRDYKTNILSLYIYKKVCPNNPANYLLFNMHVDDGAYMSTSPHLTVELKSILTQHFGQHEEFPVTWHDKLTEYCRISFKRLANASICVHMGPHILKMLSKEGMDALPDALTPALADVFDAPTESTPYDPTSYQSTQGGLIYLTPVRTDNKLPINHLSNFNLHPTQSHRAK